MAIRWAVLLGVVALAMGPTALAGPAFPDPFPLQQPDGTVFVARRGGDERIHWVEVDGHVVRKGVDGFWRYVVATEGRFEMSDRRLGLEAPPTGAATPAELVAQRAAFLEGQPALSRWQASQRNITPPGSDEPLLVILAGFTDRTFQTTETQWAEAFLSLYGKTVRTYFRSASCGRFDLVPAREDYGSANDGVVRIRLNRVHPNPGGDYQAMSNRQIVRDALVAADTYVDFAAFDADHNGAIRSGELHLVVVVAGYEGEDQAPSVWGQSSSLGDVPAPTLDGVKVCDYGSGGSYTMAGELIGNKPTPIGVFCHELGHDLGLPDLYDLDDSSYGVGVHCLMAGGSWGRGPDEESGACPVLPSAWCRVKLGWVTPTMATAAGPYKLVQSSDPNPSIVKVSTNRADEYFLLENRQLSGFDMGLYKGFEGVVGGADGGGIAIWHIDEAMSNNDNEARKLVDLEEANESAAGGAELDRKVHYGSRFEYYYEGNFTEFSGSTVPNSRLYSGNPSGVTVSAVSISGPTMMVTIEPRPSAPAPPASGSDEPSGGGGGCPAAGFGGAVLAAGMLLLAGKSRPSARAISDKP